MTLLGKLNNQAARFPFQGIGVNGRLELDDEPESPERIVTCVECAKSMPESQAFQTRDERYVCKGQCLNEYSENDAIY